MKWNISIGLYHENFPVALQVNVTVFVIFGKSFPFKDCIALAVADALLLLFEADLLTIRQLSVYTCVETEDLVHFEVPFP